MICGIRLVNIPLALVSLSTSAQSFIIWHKVWETLPSQYVFICPVSYFVTNSFEGLPLLCISAYFHFFPESPRICHFDGFFFISKPFFVFHILQSSLDSVAPSPPPPPPPSPCPHLYYLSFSGCASLFFNFTPSFFHSLCKSPLIHSQ